MAPPDRKILSFVLFLITYIVVRSCVNNFSNILLKMFVKKSHDNCLILYWNLYLCTEFEYLILPIVHVVIFLLKYN